MKPGSLWPRCSPTSFSVRPRRGGGWRSCGGGRSFGSRRLPLARALGSRLVGASSVGVGGRLRRRGRRACSRPGGHGRRYSSTSSRATGLKSSGSRARCDFGVETSSPESARSTRRRLRGLPRSSRTSRHSSAYASAGRRTFVGAHADERSVLRVKLGADQVDRLRLAGVDRLGATVCDTTDADDRVPHRLTATAVRAVRRIVSNSSRLRATKADRIEGCMCVSRAMDVSKSSGSSDLDGPAEAACDAGGRGFKSRRSRKIPANRIFVAVLSDDDRRLHFIPRSSRTGTSQRAAWSGKSRRAGDRPMRRASF